MRLLFPHKTEETFQKILLFTYTFRLCTISIFNCIFHRIWNFSNNCNGKGNFKSIYDTISWLIKSLKNITKFPSPKRNVISFTNYFSSRSKQNWIISQLIRHVRPRSVELANSRLKATCPVVTNYPMSTIYIWRNVLRGWIRRLTRGCLQW